MPAPLRATNATRRPGAPTKLDIGKQTGAYDTDSIRQRVHKWQKDGAAAKDDEDVIVVEYEDESTDASPTKKAPINTPDNSRTRRDPDRRERRTSPIKSPGSPRELDYERQAWVRRKSTPRNELDPELKHAGAPIKRVVSDAHWRKDRSPIKKADVTPKSGPSPYTIKRTAVYTGRDTPTKAKQDDDGIRVIPIKEKDDGIRITPSKGTEGGIRITPIKEKDDGIRITPIKDKDSAPSKERTPKSDNDHRPSSRETKPRAPQHTPNKASEDELRRRRDRSEGQEVRRDSSRRRRRLRRHYGSPSASEAEVEDASIAPTVVPDDSISARNGHSRKQFKALATDERLADKENPSRLSKPRTPERKSPKTPDIPPPTAAPPQVFGNRIEAWLTGTPSSSDPVGADDSLNGTEDTPQVTSSRQRSQKSPKDENASRRRSLQRPSARHSDSDEPRSKPSPGEHSRGLGIITESVPSTNDDETSSCATSSVPATDIFTDVKVDKHAPGANLRRRFPTTGKRLSTIASAETLLTSAAPSEVSEQDTIVPDRAGSTKGGSGLKRRLTRHEDLMSVLSLPVAESKSIVSARSIRTNRTRLEEATIDDVWAEFSADESKYQRELRTLVDGVIPVLLSCVLSKSESAVAAGLFGRSTTDDSIITKPIVDMGVALERLKAHHRRVPKSDHIALLNWAQGAIRIYTDYLKAWRMGFQDVVVNLAPADTSSGKGPGWDEGLPRNDDGDLINGDGERVDVAFLLKRPLVRLKYLSKTFKGFHFLSPSPLANTMAEKYQELVTEARRRSNEERARLEDEAAANIDPTRARDPKSLALLAGVSIDPTRCVRARDYFDMDLRHSSGQQLDCKIELLYRDDTPERGSSGDVLVCEISDTGRWLLFPPIRRGLISSRAGNGPGDIVVMIRGRASEGNDWHELLSLHATDEETGPEWVQMLGTDPVPPSVARQSSFLAHSSRPASRQAKAPASPTAVQKSKEPSPQEIEIPIGERARSPSRSLRSDLSGTEILASAPEHVRPSSSSGSSSKLQRKPVTSGAQDLYKVYTLPNSPLRESMTAVPDAPPSPSPQADGPGSPGLRRSKATRHRTSPPISPSSSRSSMQFPVEDQPRSRSDRPTHVLSRSETESSLGSYDSQSTVSQSRKDYSVWMPPSTVPSDESEDEEDFDRTPPFTPTRPPTHHRNSSVPSLNLSQTPKLRQASPPSSPSGSPEQTRRPAQVRFQQDEQETSSPNKLQKRRQSFSGADSRDNPSSSPAKDSPPPKPKRFSIPSFTPAFLRRHRRSSSPLKHEYEPSSATESSTGSESSYSDDESFTSESADGEAEDFNEAKSPGLSSINRFDKATPPDSLASLPENTISPSQSASQAPYRAVPPQANNSASRTVASIFSWSDRGSWESLHPQECTIVVTPGLIEAFDMAEAAPSRSADSDITSPSTRGVRPLVAFEVTPLVPLRRGTALDISIRSPPTSNSLIRASNNVMFRSRSTEECEILYSLINMARINNPTYIALQNARGPLDESTWAAAMDQRNDQRSSSGSWFHMPLRRSSTYRSKASRAPSIVTDSSVGTTNSAFSALRRFNGSNRLFNIAKSTITSRQGSRSGTSESLSSGASTPVVFDPTQGTPLGITNAKIRLYFRESQNKWRDMGSARLTIMLPPRPSPGAPVNPRTVGMEKRILIFGKTKGETLLDVTLGESCFERVARTGIAVSVWEDKTGPTAVGGVLSSKAKTYMVQHKTERECAYTFGLVGKLRY